MANILADAEDVTSGARREHYGKPEDNHDCTAQMMIAYLERAYGVTVPLTAVDVCYFNILQKISRLANTYHRDGLVDIAGYARNVEMIVSKPS
jgi:hypothetical protein